ncbi:MAG: hypothetical protein NTU98_11240 [Bacteroidetes bacterium]|nr:hypothetical protein [Bacteroidota bacterium]
MRQIIIRSACIFFIWFAWMWSSYAQKIAGPVVEKPVYFDISPPLSSIYASLPSKKEQPDAEKGEREIRNYFQWKLKHNKSKINSDESLIQRVFGKMKPDSTLENFEGTPNVNTAIPPDTYGDVGRNQYVHMVNLSFTVFNKSGTILLGPMDTQTIWNGLPNAGNSGDGTLLYDDQADRWFITNYFMPNYPSAPYFIFIGVSQTSDPAGSWYRWEYQFDNIPDYPKFGVWRDAYFMTCNRWFSENNFDGIGAAAFDRAAMLAGDPSPTMVLFKFIHNQSVFCLLPADCDGPFPFAETPGYFAYSDADFLGLYEFHTDWVSPSNSTFGNLKKIDINLYNGNAEGIPQKGSDVLLDPHSGNLMCRLQYRRFFDHQSMVVNQTVKAGDHHTGIRWYELRRTTGNWSLYQESTYAPDSNSRWMGSIAMDSAGNIALGYSVSGYNLYPSIRFTGRMKNDPINQMTIAEQSIIEGGGAQTHPASTYARWGDYSSMTVDPSNPSIFWYTQQYYPVTADYNWHTRVGSFSFANILQINAIAAYPTICPGQSDQLDVELSGGGGNYTYSWTSIPDGFTSTLKNPVVSPEFLTRYIVTVTAGNQSRTDTIQVSITPPPAVFAGDDTISCRYITEIPLSGSAENYIFLKWITAGDGTFSDPYAISTTYFTGPKDRSDSIIDLELMGYPQPPCPVVSDHKLIRMDTCSGISPADPLSNSLKIFPNPCRDYFYISIPAKALFLEFTDMPGNMILSVNLATCRDNVLIFNFSDKPKGMYTVRIILKDRIISDKLVLQ